jgi:hypothetical protein
MRLVDFQALLQAPHLPREVVFEANASFFPVFESVRLWLKENKVEAPFRKVVVTATDERVSQQWHGSVTNVLGICEVTLGIDISSILEGSSRIPAMVSVIELGLRCVAASTAWRSEPLSSHLGRMRGSNPPCAHRFASLHREWRGVGCDALFQADVGRSAVIVQFTDPTGPVGEHTLIEKDGPLYLEDDFPLVASRVARGEYVLVGRRGLELGRMPIPFPRR